MPGLVPGIHVLALVAITPHVAGAHAGYSLKRSPDEQSDIRDLHHPHVADAHAGYKPFAFC
jgi:hypothetical protein